MRKICFFTGTRAEYGLLSTLMRRVQEDDTLQLQVVATNMHLSPEFGMTYREIEADGFHIDKKVEMLLSSETAAGTVKSMGLATIGFADALDDLQPDLAVILGDRYEMLAAAQACLIYHIPVAHLYGGEVTEGAYDDAIRHAITKLSHLHFTSTEEYRRHVIQMGEQPDHVYFVGALGVDNIGHADVMPLKALEDSLHFRLGEKFLLVTFHPVTMEHHTAAGQCDDLLQALSEVNDDYRLLFTLPNSDTGGRVIISKVNDYVAEHPDRAVAVTSLGRRRYYAALRYATAVVGNSSSGLVEAPSFHLPTLNIGDRQKGRARGASVVDVAATYEAIRAGLHQVLSPDFQAIAAKASNPYAKADTAQSIFNVISTCPLHQLTHKHFYEIKTKL